ncbi:hypothetical protein [Nocardioides convexus]|uniref:non-homologous end-joining DNA ligase LigD n=1 Tax=Nocardioides convexus TaxID=2712224 RepID=UPI0024189D7B|nr:hypothetical protein [Nocardioides convexus]
MPKKAEHPQTEVHVDVEGRTLRLTNLEKVLYPQTGTTKGEVLDYYARVAPVLLPHLAGRPVTRIRWPHGVGDKSLLREERPRRHPLLGPHRRRADHREPGPEPARRHPPVPDHRPGSPPWCGRSTWPRSSLHVHQWTVDEDDEPVGADRVVIDLDPGEPAGLHECCAVALLARDALAERGLDALPVTSGSKGLHLYAPLEQPLPSTETSETRQGDRRGACRPRTANWSPRR